MPFFAIFRLRHVFITMIKLCTMMTGRLSNRKVSFICIQSAVAAAPAVCVAIYRSCSRSAAASVLLLPVAVCHRGTD